MKKGGAVSSCWHCWLPDLNNTEPCTSLNSYRNATTEANLQAKVVLREGTQVASLCNMLSGPKLAAARQQCQPRSSCPGKKKDAHSSTVSAVWCWTINPGKWADHGSFWLLPWLMRATVADSSCLPRMHLLKYSDSATITQTLKLANIVRLCSVEQVWASKSNLFDVLDTNVASLMLIYA